MYSGTWDTLFNLLLLVFWCAIWMEKEPDGLLNPYIGPIRRISNTLIAFLRPVFLDTPPRVIAAVSLVFLIVFRSFLVPVKSHWVLILGFEIREAQLTSMAACLAFSALSFLLFIFRVWGMAWLISLFSSRSATRNASEAIGLLALPFSRARIQNQLPMLLLAGLVLSMALHAAGLPYAPATDLVPGMAQDPTPGQALIRFGVNSLAAVVSLLATAQSIMMLLIIGSLASLLTASVPLAMTCKEWIDLFLGPFRRFPIIVGVLDLTPIIFFFVVGVLHSILLQALLSIYGGIS